MIVVAFPFRLTNEESKENYEKYGNPDGPGGKLSGALSAGFGLSELQF